MEFLNGILEFVSSPAVVVVGAMTIFEIVPIKISPWTALLRWIGDVVNGDLRRELSELKRDFEETKAQDKRWRILDFARSCREGRQHSREEWKHVISELAEYEDYTERKHIKNGVIEEDAKYLRELYHDRLKNNDFT